MGSDTLAPRLDWRSALALCPSWLTQGRVAEGPGAGRPQAHLVCRCLLCPCEGVFMERPQAEDALSSLTLGHAQTKRDTLRDTLGDGRQSACADAHYEVSR